MKDTTRFLKKYVNEYEAKSNVARSFDINKQDETGYVLGEYGAFQDTWELVHIDQLTYKNVDEIFDYLRSGGSKDWKISKVYQDFIWFLPALEAWGIDFDDINEEECIKSFLEVYPRHSI